MKHVCTLVLTIAMLCCLAADEAKPAGPKSPAATAAIAKMNGAIKKAKADYDAAVKLAQSEAIRELDAAKAAAMKAGNLPEANAIQAAIEKTSKDAPSGKSGQSPAEIAARVKTFKYFWGKQPRDMELLPDGSIGKGSGVDEKRWKAKPASIVVSGSNGDIELFACEDGAFRGVNTSGVGLVLMPPGTTQSQQ